MSDEIGRSLGALKLDDVVEAVARLYAQADSRRSTWDIWLHLSHHAGELSLALRREAGSESVNRELADVTLWLLTLMGRVARAPDSSEEQTVERLLRASKGAEALLLLRYGNGCPACLPEVSPKSDGPGGMRSPGVCRCVKLADSDHLSEEKLSEVLSAAPSAARRQEATVNSVVGMDRWQTFVATLFQRTLAEFSPAQMGALLSEQVGFVSDSMIRLYSYSTSKPPTAERVRFRQRRFELELAKLFCLIFLICEKLGMKLSEIVSARYTQGGKGLICWSCGGPECECKILIAPHDVAVAEIAAHLRV